MDTSRYFKSATLAATGRLTEYFDVANVVQNGAITRLFPRVPLTQNDYDSNYQSNPLPGTVIRNVLGLKLTALVPTFSTDAANAINPAKFLAALADSVIKITVDSNDTKILLAPISDFLDLRNYDVANADKAGVTQTTISLKEKGVVDLADPFFINQGQPFKMEILHARSADFPSTANWVAAGFGGGFRLRAGIWVHEA